MVNYYFARLSEARERLQLLCANCNWVKRVRNGEGRNGACSTDTRVLPSMGGPDMRRVLVENKLTGIPGYLELLDAFRGLRGCIVSAAEPDLLDILYRDGISDSTRSPLSSHLVRCWEKQRFYSDSEQDLARFVGEMRFKLGYVADILQKRTQGSG